MSKYRFGFSRYTALLSPILWIEFFFIILLTLTPGYCQAGLSQPLLIGLDADMSSGSAKSGSAILRGMTLAVDEINAAGGLLGRPIQIVVRDHRGNPSRGIDNIKEFAKMGDLLAVMGGLHTPVVLAELETIHEFGIVFLDPWAAGTTIIDNGYTPNFVFRISIRDEFAGQFLVNKALDRGYRNIALLLENTPWGRSNKKAMEKALQSENILPTTVQWLNWGTHSTRAQLQAILDSGAETILLVANAPEGSVVVSDLVEFPVSSRLPVLSHWGIAGGDFFSKTSSSLHELNFSFLQTRAFYEAEHGDIADQVLQAYNAKYPDQVLLKGSPTSVGTAHAYDLTKILALAVKLAGSADMDRIRDALEKVQSFDGIIKKYEPPFSVGRHDALDAADFRIARYNRNGTIEISSP